MSQMQAESVILALVENNNRESIRIIYLSEEKKKGGWVHILGVDKVHCL